MKRVIKAPKVSSRVCGIEGSLFDFRIKNSRAAPRLKQLLGNHANAFLPLFECSILAHLGYRQMERLFAMSSSELRRQYASFEKQLAALCESLWRLKAAAEYMELAPDVKWIAAATLRVERIKNKAKAERPNWTGRRLKGGRPTRNDVSFLADYIARAFLQLCIVPKATSAGTFESVLALALDMAGVSYSEESVHRIALKTLTRLHNGTATWPIWMKMPWEEPFKALERSFLVSEADAKALEIK